MTSPMTKLGLVLANATEKEVEAPLPGVYPGISHVEYHRWPGASNSRLSKIRQSPAHLKAYLDEPTPDAAHFAQGRAIHSAVLEPEDFATRYVTSERCTATKKGDGLRCTNDGVVYAGGEWFCGVHGKGITNHAGAIVLSALDYELCIRARDSIFAHPKARRLLEGQGMNELSAVWNDAATGLLCKARLDRFTPVIVDGVIADVKSTRDASRDAFERSIYSFGYHRQGAHYLDGAHATGLQAKYFVNIAVEKERPYAVALYELTEGAIQAGADQLAPLKARYAKCIATNEWPGYSENIEPAGLPTYAWGQIDTEIKEAVA